MVFVRCPVEPCLYIITIDNDYIYISIHVDDGLRISTKQELIDEFKLEFKRHIRNIEMSQPLNKYIGFELKQDNEYINLGQSIDINKMDLYDINDKSYTIPMFVNTNLRNELRDENNESLLPLIGKLRYYADCTRPDISMTLGKISSGGADTPSDKHIKCAKHLYSYIKNSGEDRMRLGGKGNNILFAFSYTSYITDSNSLSRLGGCIFYGYDSGAIHSFSKNDTTVSHSSTEAEIKAKL